MPCQRLECTVRGASFAGHVAVARLFALVISRKPLSGSTTAEKIVSVHVSHLLNRPDAEMAGVNPKTRLVPIAAAAANART